MAGMQQFFRSMHLRKCMLYRLGMGENRPRKILVTSAGRLFPSKARLRVAISYRMHPSPQTSLIVLYGLSSQISVHGTHTDGALKRRNACYRA